jgi:iron complex outermembrane receptor protein
MTKSRTILAMSIASALAFGGPTQAQEAREDAAELDAIVVTGIRGSLQRSLDSKRDSDSLVEVITAEDIGKMPDKNIADTLQRVPGINISSASATEGGFDENDRVSMRGTSPSLTQTLINGHFVSSGDWFVLNQTGSVGRSVSYSLLPSELVGEIVVYKTAQASQVEGGVVGSIDIRTRKPLDFSKDLSIEASLGTVYADLPDEYSPQLSALLNWKNPQGNFGVMVQGFSEERHLRRDGQEMLGYDTIAPGSPIALSNPDLSGVAYPVLIGSAHFEQERKRTGGLVTFDLRPNDDLSLSLTAFTSKLDADNYNRNLLLWNSRIIAAGQGQAPRPGYVVRNGTLVQAEFDPIAGNAYGVYDQISRPGSGSSSRFVNFDASFRASDALSFEGKVGQSRGRGKTPTQDVAEWDMGIGSGASYRLNGLNGAADWSLGNWNVSSPNNTPLDWIFGAQNVNVRDESNWAQLDGDFVFAHDTLRQLQFGLRWNDSERSAFGAIGQGPACSNGDAFNWDPATFNCPDPATSPFNPANFPQGFTLFPGDYAQGIGGNFPRAIWQYSPEQLAEFNRRFTTRDPVSRAYWQGDYGLQEDSKAAYVQLDFGGASWSGDVGVRYVRTTSEALVNVAATADTPGAVTSSAFGPYLPTVFSKSYNDLLPSANLRFEVSDDSVLRVAASRTMARPDYSALAGPINLSPPPDLNAPNAVGSGSGSNPFLDPVRSNNIDLSYEWYFAPRALLSAGVYYMDLTSYITVGRERQQYLSFNQQNPSGILVPYDLTVPINSSGSVKGLELAWQQPLGEQFGFFANYTYADGEEDGGGELVGTSKNTANLGGYFENERFNVRLNYNYRSEFYSGLDRASAFSQDSVGNVSASFGYKINDMLSLSLDGLNLNDPTLKYYAGSPDQPRAFLKNGRQYYLNLRLSF